MGCDERRGGPVSWLKSLSLFTRLAWLSGIVIVIAISMTQIYFARHERTSLEMRLREKANFINNFYAVPVADALQHNDDIMLLQLIKGLEDDPEITSVIVVDGTGIIRYHVDAEQIGGPLEDKLVKSALSSGEGIASEFQNSGGRALALVSPLKIRGQAKPKGALRIDFTYRHIAEQVKTGQASFRMVALGSILSCLGGIIWGVRRWVLYPLGRLQSRVAALNPALLDAHFPESNDEFGRVNQSINEFLAKLKVEWNAQRSALAAQAADERVLVEQFARGFMPKTRVMIADKDNRVICDTASAEILSPAAAPHLLDLFGESELTELLAKSLQQEGVPARGRATFQEQLYDAAVLCIPLGQSKLVRIVIALDAVSTLDNQKEAV
jgi:hypothetical protein